jgi:hypothetical protein
MALGLRAEKAHFYWGSECTSFLRYLSIASFQLLNPDWEIYLYVPTTLYRGGAGWTTPEVYEGSAYQGRDYSRQLFSLPGLHICEVDFADFPEISQAPEIYKSDFFRWHILDQEGGVYSDTDIVFNRPIREAPFNSRENHVTRVHAAQGSRTFSMGGYFDSARGCLEFLNSRPFEDLFPWLDIKSTLAIGMAMKATCLVAIAPHSFIYQGVGANTVLLERLDEWLQANCPAGFGPLAHSIREIFLKDPFLSRDHLDTLSRLGTPERKPFQPQDPLQLMEQELARLQNCGEIKAADELRHYLVKIVGRKLPPALDPSAPRCEGFLIEPDWTGSDWAMVFLSYLEAFTESDPVRLIFLLDPARNDQITVEEATNRLMEIVNQTGLKKFPDVVLVNQMEELDDITRNLSRLQRIENGGVDLKALEGGLGSRLLQVHLRSVSSSQAIGNPVVEPGK